MKKLFSLFLALTMLVGMMAMFATTASAADVEALKVVAVYRINGNNDDLYVVFNKKVAAPAAENDLALVLNAYGWDGTPGDWDKANTAIGRVHFPFTAAVSDQVFKFTRAGHVSWACDGGNINGENVAVTPVNGYWFWGLCGNTTVTTADGAETMVQDIEKVYNVYGHTDAPWEFSVPCTTIAKTESGALPAVDSADKIEVPAPLDSIKPVEPEQPAPDTFDALTIVALVGIAASGAIVATKKRH